MLKTAVKPGFTTVASGTSCGTSLQQLKGLVPTHLALKHSPALHLTSLPPLNRKVHKVRAASFVNSQLPLICSHKK